jgi:hypothetical protein
MNLDWKKILLVIGFLIGVLIIGYLLYYLFLKPAIPTSGPNANANAEPGLLPPAGTNVNIPTISNINGALPGQVNSSLAIPPEEIPAGQTVSSVATGGLTETQPLTTGQALYTTLSSDKNSIIYYDRNSGLIYQVGSDGKTKAFSDQIFYDVQNITWSAKNDKAILEYPDGSNIVYDFVKKEQVTLPQHWKEFSFSPNGDRIILKSMGQTEETRWLAISNADGSNAYKLEHLGNEDEKVDTAWSPQGQIVAMYRKSKSFDREDLYFLGLNNENLKSTVVEGRGFESKWSTDGNRLLYSVYSSNSSYKPTLWIVQANGDNIGKNRINLQLQTWVDKCSFSGNDTVYCAVPQELGEGAGIFPTEMDNAACDLYKIDLKTGSKTRVAIPQGSHNIGSVMVSEDEKYLYFSSENTGRLYKINLK